MHTDADGPALSDATNDAMTDEIDARMRARIDDGTAPAGAWALVERGELAHAGAHALDGIPVPDAVTPFRIASCTKSFTAATLLLLRDRGLIELDAPIGRYVEAAAALELPDGWPQPTVRDLLSMSGGLPTDDPWADRLESMATDAFDALIAAGLRFATPPGTAYEYSNLGYALLGRAITAVTGRDFRAVIHDDLLAPLGLHGTGWDLHVHRRVALGRSPEPGADEQRLRTAAGWREQPFTASGAFSSMGGLFSTLADLGRWTDFLGSAFSDNPVAGPLCAASRRELQQIHRVMPGPPEHRVPIGPTMGYGFGVIVDTGSPSGDVVAHSGGYPGYTTHMRWSTAARRGFVAFELAPYTGLVRDMAPMFEALLARDGVRAPAPAPWPELTAAGRLLEAALRSPDAWPIAQRILAPNIEQDEPLELRRQRAAAAVASVGGLAGAGSLEPLGAAEGDWTVPAVHGSITVELLLTPTDPPLVQHFDVTASAEQG